MSLYRKYRPHAFSDVIGQEHVITTLQNAVAQDKVAHAYLFAGSRGTGKTSVARILAKELLTRGMDDATLKRQVEKAVDEGNLVDLVEIDAASNRGIDDIRTLVEKIQFTPVAAKAKVYIIDEVHMLTREAFNALLKTLEEPPAYAFFILATTELQKIPATIQSRCQRFTFRQLAIDDIVLGLRRVSDAEGIKADDAALQAIARHAQGGMRDALSLLDQLRSLPQVTADDVRQRTGESGQEYIEGLLQAIDNSDRSAILTTVAAIERAGIALDVFTRQLLTAIRSRLHDAVDAKQNIASITRMLDILLHALRDIRLAPVPGLALESALLSLCDAESDTAPIPPKAKPQQSSPPIAKAPEPAPVPKAVVSEKKAESPAPTLATPAPKAKSAKAEVPSSVSIEQVRSVWPEVLRSVSPASVKMSLKNAQVQSLRGNTLILSFSSAFHRDKVKATDGARAVEETIEKILHVPLGIECTLDEEQHTKAARKEDLVNLAEAASEVF